MIFVILHLSQLDSFGKCENEFRFLSELFECLAEIGRRSVL